MRLNRLIGVQACALLLATSAATAQDAQAREDVLRGPRVQERRAPGTEQSFGPEDRRRAAESAVRLRAFMGALRSLNAPDVPESLRLSDEQARAIREIFASRRELAAPPTDARPDQAPGATDRAPRSDDRAARPSDRAPRTTDRADRPSDRAQRSTDRPDRVTDRAPQNRARPDQPADSTPGPRADRRTMADAPGDAMSTDPSRVQTEIWGLLNEKQREHVAAEMERRRDQRERERLEARMAARAPADAPGRPDRAAPSIFDEMPARLRERLAAMTPEQRQALWSRIDNALASSDKAPDEQPPARRKPRRPDR
jgi:hypothetical protein